MPKGIVSKKKDVKSIKDNEGIGEQAQGLKLVWISFLNEYIKLGCKEAGKAYKIAYKVPEMKDNVASVNACKLLKNANIREELNNKLETQKITGDYIHNGFLYLFNKHKDGKGAVVAVMAMEKLAKMKGLLNDTHKFEFDDKNPANVPPVVPADRSEKIRQAVKGGGVIE